MKTNLDGMVREFRDKCRQSILKDFPKFNAYCGVTNVNNMTCDERIGVLFLLTVMLLNEEVWEKLEGLEFKDTYVDDKGVTQPVTYTVQGFVYVFEMFLCSASGQSRPIPCGYLAVINIGGKNWRSTGK